MLGKGNEEAAMDALRAWPGMLPRRFSFYAMIDEQQGGLQVGGGINETNATKWIEAGASKVRPNNPDLCLLLTYTRLS